MTKFTRRQALAAAAIAPAAVLPAGVVLASAEKQGPASGNFNRFTMGDLEITTLLAGSAVREEPQKMFAINVDAEEFSAESERNFLPADKFQLGFTPTLINNGSELILFDTGLNPQGTTAVLEAAGYTPDQVNRVVFTHFHGDHIGGMSGDAGETFANATYTASSAEDNHWAAAGNDNYEAKVRPLAEKFSFIEDGASIAPGVTAMATNGHTPGHTSYIVESGGKSVLIFGDIANHYVWSLANPDWHFGFDVDKDQAVKTRRMVLDMLATEKMPFIGYHMPFPGLGYVEKDGDGFRFVPASYQMNLG